MNRSVERIRSDWIARVAVTLFVFILLIDPGECQEPDTLIQGLIDLFSLFMISAFKS